MTEKPSLKVQLAQRDYDGMSVRIVDGTSGGIHKFATAATLIACRRGLTWSWHSEENLSVTWHDPEQGKSWCDTDRWHEVRAV